MILNSDGMKPIYVQISEWLENEIIDGTIGEDQKIYSQYQLADIYNINPATAAKGLNILADSNILYKKRGLGMFVTPNAKELILEKRRNQTLKSLVIELVSEAQRLNVSDDELFEMIQNAKNNLGGKSK
jgi:DNA-binding transcriptional regulator YhcF (GntR family)